MNAKRQHTGPNTMIVLPEEAEVTFSHLFFPKVKTRSHEVVTKHDLSTKPEGMEVFA